jgi:hypothetical protein
MMVTMNYLFHFDVTSTVVFSDDEPKKAELIRSIINLGEFVDSQNKRLRLAIANFMQAPLSPFSQDGLFKLSTYLMVV